MIGKTISHYKILEKLGEGGMGVVYKAMDTRLDRIVALKFLAPHAVGGDEEQGRLIREAKSAAALNHPNICTIYEIDKAEGRTFIAMECVEGQSLKGKIAAGPMALDEAVDVAIQVTGGLGQAHSKGIIHRDIKPANIMLTPEGPAKIMDFGLAKSLGGTILTQTGTTIGTVAYMSPEQARGGDVDARADIWSLGAVLYEMVTGQRPFKGDYEQAVIYQILNETPKTVTELRPDAPRELARIVGKAMAGKLAERYGSADDFRKDLEFLRRSSRSESAGRSVEAEDPKPSIAVLPFRDMSPERDQDYFCEGIAEELINALVKLDGLRVAARTSAFQFKDRDSDVKKVGAELDVRTVLEGSVRKSGDRLRITAQLINVEDGFHIWSEKYDRDLEDIFSIQDEISLAIVDKLKVRLLGGEKKVLVRRHTTDQEAHNYYLKGLYFWNRRHEGGMKMAMENFHLAIEKDPDYALAHVGIADTHNITGLFGYLPPNETFPKAKAAAARALEIDPTLGEAHASLGFVEMFYDWDWVAAESEFRRAIELSPKYATAHEWYAILLSILERSDEAIARAERSHELDPISLIINSVLGLVYYFARRYDESIAAHKRALELDPNFLPGSAYAALVYVENGMCDRAVEIVSRVEASATGDAYTLGYSGYVYGVCEREEDALRILETLNELAKVRYVSPMHRSFVLLGLGRLDAALDSLNEAYAERCPSIVVGKPTSVYEPLLSDPRYRELLRKIGLED
jgi:serine/threonine protein kinase/tetratricopeptide (TPR) repeat protein